MDQKAFQPPNLVYSKLFDQPEGPDNIRYEEEEEGMTPTPPYTMWDDTITKFFSAGTIEQLLNKLTLLKIYPTEDEEEAGLGDSGTVGDGAAKRAELKSKSSADFRTSSGSLPSVPSANSSSTNIPVPPINLNLEPNTVAVANPLLSFPQPQVSGLTSKLALTRVKENEKEKEREKVRQKEQHLYWVGEEDMEADDEKAKIGSKMKKKVVRKEDKKKKEELYLKEKGAIDAFLLAYDPYIGPADLMELLITRYLGPQERTPEWERIKNQVQNSVIYFLKRWMEFRPYLFVETPALNARLDSFMSHISLPVESPQQKIVSSAKEVLKGWKMLQKTQLLENPDVGYGSHPVGSMDNIRFTLTRPTFGMFVLDETPSSGRNDGDVSTQTTISPNTPLYKLDAQELANQLTLIEFKLIRSVRCYEYIKQAWNKKDSATKAPRLVQAVDWFNRMSRWFSTEIAKEDSIDARGDTIVLLIEVALKCHALNNFNTVMEILSSLHSSSISSLKQSWMKVPNKLAEEFDKLAKLMTPKSNFTKYREALKYVKPPTVPYIGHFLKDLTFLDDCKPDRVDGLVNFDKIKNFGQTIKDIQSLQTKKYKGITVKIDWRQRIFGAEVFDDNEIFRISKLREEKGGYDTIGKKKGVKNNEYYARLDLTGQQTVSTKDSEITSRDWALMLTGANLVNYKKNDVIMEEGTYNQHLYRVKTGRVRVEKLQDGDQPPIFVATLPQDSMFGEMSVLDRNGKTTARIVADDDNVSVYLVELKFVFKLFETQDGLSRRFFQSLAKKLAKRLREKSASQVQPKLPEPEHEQAPSTKNEPNTLSVNSSSRRSSFKKQDSTTILPKNKDKKPQPSSPSVDVKSETTDEKVNRKFALGGSELIIKEYPASLVMTMTHNGTLYILQSCVAFYSKVFSVETKESLLISEIGKVEKKDDRRLNLSSKDGKKKMNLRFKVERDEAFNIIQSLMEKRGSDSNEKEVVEQSKKEEEKKIFEEPAYEDPLAKEDWDMLLKGAKSVQFAKDEVVITEGQQYQRLYQLNKGSCRIEKMKKDLGFKMRAGETFGEISFLEGGGAAVTVIADEPTELFIIEGYFINILFDMKPGLAGKFFHYLCTVLAGRLVGKAK